MKNHQKCKISISFEKLELDLSFGEDFDEIHQLARFLDDFEIFKFSDFRVDFSDIGKKGLP